MARTEFQPMLATAVPQGDLSMLRYPGLLSPKLDGIRATVRNGVLVSRKLKPIPNEELQARYGRHEFEGLDGELITGAVNAPNVFLRTQSCVMSRVADPLEVAQTVLQVFDDASHPAAEFQYRYSNAEGWLKTFEGFAMVPHVIVKNEEELLQMEHAFVEQGFEGAMWRDPNGPYKYGRSTLREGWLLKLKRFMDDEYMVIGFEERMHNTNEQQRDERGYAKRSSAKAGMIGTGILGAFLARGLTGPYEGVEFKVTPTGAEAERRFMWANRDSYLHTTRKFKFFPSGSKESPRFPVDLGLRMD
jgi:DNA ligase-1